MSESGHQDIAVLLPEARVAIYTRDAQVLEAARELENDWRFARVTIQVEEGDVATAISAYSELPSPDVLIVQTETIDDGFAGRLEDLAGNCDEGTSAVVIGPENDVNLYRNLIDMGVSDYLVRPVQTPVLADVVAKALIEKIGVTGSLLVAVEGAKGGVGTSLLAEGLACGLSDILKQKTILLDAAGGWSTLGVGLGFEPSTTLSEAVRAAGDGNEDNLKRMMHSVDERLQVLATGGDVMLEQDVSAAQLETLIDMLMVKSPVVVVDLSHSPEVLQKVVLARANLTLLVSTPTLPALRLTRALLGEIQEVRGGDSDTVRLVVNMQGVCNAHEVSKKDIEDAVGHSVSAFIPFSPKAFLGSESTSKKLTEDKETREILENHLLPIVRPFLDISGSADEDDDSAGGLLGGLLGKLSGG